MTTPGELTFIDTNILIYAHGGDDSDPRAKRARARLTKLWRDSTGVASTQVLQEFYAVATKKLKPPLSRIQARAVVAAYADWCRISTDPQLIVAASLLEEQHSLSFRDALIVEAALRSAASTLLSEDLQDGRKFHGLTFENPFRDLSGPGR
jgi:predicted nucleic acid-binding protein